LNILSLNQQALPSQPSTPAMAFILTPRFAPAYQAPQCNPFGFCAPVSRPTSGYRVSRPQPRRPQYSSYNFLSQVDDLLSEIDREAQRQAQLEAHLEAQREAHRQRQLQRKRALRAEFKVNQNEQGWQIDGDIQGFGQENMVIEALDEHTLKIAGNTKWVAGKAQPEGEQPLIESAPVIEQATEETHTDTDGVTPDEPEAETTTEIETTTAGAATPDSDTASHKSYQATVEDDFEDLGADFPSSSSSRPSTPAESTESKGKEKAVEQPATTETAVTQQPQPEAPVPVQQHQESQQQERVHGSFERTFRFPERIDAANVSASFKDGVLRVLVPRAQVPQSRRIAIL
jgi:HSP20 family molecular chaperone IbpA